MHYYRVLFYHDLGVANGTMRLGHSALFLHKVLLGSAKLN